MNCPNCKNPLIVPPMLIMTHVDTQIDCRTGQAFIPVKRITDDVEVELWPEDYICSKVAA